MDCVTVKICKGWAEDLVQIAIGIHPIALSIAQKVRMNLISYSHFLSS